MKIAGPTLEREDWEALNGMGDDKVDADVRSRSAEVLAELAESPSDLITMVTYYQVAAGSVPSAAIAQQSRIVLDSLLSSPTENGDTAFPDAGVYAVYRNDALLHRIKLVSVLLHAQHDSRLKTGDLSELQANNARGATVFDSSAGLQEGFYLLDQYIGPVLGALTPAIWGFATHRANGPIIYSFGRAVAGSGPTASELLGTLPTRGSTRVAEFTPLDPHAIPAALDWWVDRLNGLFGVITDPSVFVNRAGVYKPALHLQAILTVEQVFSRVLSIQATHHDVNARRVLLFTVLDSMEALTGRPIEKHCDLTFAEKTLHKLTAAMSPSARQLLTPRAAAGIDALRELQDGFFIREADGSVMFRPSVDERIPVARAAAEYLKLLRNATHGHGTVRRDSIETTETLLARHDGRVQHEIALLGWLYLLDLLNRPDALRSHLSARAHRSDATA